MGAIALPYGVQLLYDDGLSPPDRVRADLANASPAQLTKLASGGLTLQTTATLLVIEDTPIDTADLSARAAAEIVAAMSATIQVSQNSSSTEPDAAATGTRISVLA